tara:strand:+ start:725 stop:1771 length:1047 start_codon:yes stop_codon:yes gene_type:complete
LKILNLNKVINEKPFIIAEISANHQQSKIKAKKLIDIASESGANAVKFQTFTPESLTLNSNDKNFVLKQDSNWSGRSLYDLYTEAATPFEWHEELFAYAKERHLIPFTSVFSIKDIPFLESLDLQIYKIASYEANDIELVEEVAKIGKPIIMSIGGCTENEVKKSVKILKKYLNNNFAVLNCLSSYPAPLKEFSFGRTTRFKDEFKVTTGLSDHSNSSDAALITLALGGMIFEKHIMLEDKNSTKPLDKDFSASKNEFKIYVDSINDSYSSLGQNKFQPMDSEGSNVILKRSIYSTENIDIGEKFTRNNTRSIRPSNGLHPHSYKKLLTMKSKRRIKANSPIKESDIA